MAKKALGKGLGAIFGDDAGSLMRPQHKIGTETQNYKPAETVVYPEETVVLSADGNAAERNIADGNTIDHNTAETNYGSNIAGSSNINVPGNSDFEAKDVSRETSLIRISLIEPNKEQPRKLFNEEKLNELADSIKEYGVIQPLIVKPNGRMYEIVAGERRWRAAKIAGLKEVPVIVREFEPQVSAEISIIENIQREDLGPVEEARAFQALIDEFGLTQEEVAEKVSKNRSTITNSLRLLQLSEKVLDLLSDGAISAGHARCLITLSHEQQEALAQEIVDKSLSVRETEKLVKQLSSEKKKPKKQEEEKELDMYLIDIARKLTASLNTKVLIKQGSRGKGKIEIDYYSNEDLEKIISRLR